MSVVMTGERLYEARVFKVKNHWKIRVEIERTKRDNEEFKKTKVVRIKEVNGQVEEEVLEPMSLKDFKYETKREKILQFARDFLPVLKDTIGVAREAAGFVGDCLTLGVGGINVNVN